MGESECRGEMQRESERTKGNKENYVSILENINNAIEIIIKELNINPGAENIITEMKIHQRALAII